MVETISAVLTNPVTLLLLGAVIKYVPKVREVIANRLIPVVNVVVALAGSLLTLMTSAVGAPPDALPSSFTVASMDMQAGFYAAGFFSFIGTEARGLAWALGSALGSAAQAYLLNKLTFAEWLTRPATSKR